MKMKIILALMMVTCLLGKETETSSNPEIQKIDTRLEELKTIWHQDNAIINRLTNFKKTPVQEGSKAYFQCVESAKRMQQAEAEAKNLKEKRSRLSLPDASSPNQPTPIRPTPNQPTPNELNLEVTTTTPYSEEYQKTSSKMKNFWTDSWIEEKSRKVGTVNKVSLSTQEERAAYAAKMFGELDPRHYLHPLERISPTLDFLKAKVTLQGKNLKEIEAFYNKGDFLGLLGFLEGSDMNQYPDIKHIKLLCEKLAEMNFFIRLNPTVPTEFSYKEIRVINGKEVKGMQEDNEISMLPYVIHVESPKAWFATALIKSSTEYFEVHPDGEQAGYLAKWNPADGPVILKLPLRPQNFYRILNLNESSHLGYKADKTITSTIPDGSTSRFGLITLEEELLEKNESEINFKLSELNSSLDKKVKIGDMTEDESKQAFINAKTDEYQRLLEYLSAW
jgi:hypothetical protein